MRRGIIQSARKRTALYLRVSTGQQSLDVQREKLRAWSRTHRALGPFATFQDTASGRSLDRPGWNSLEAQIEGGQIRAVVVVRLDRLGRTAAGLVKLFRDLVRQKVRLISLSEGIDLGTPAGRLICDVIASVAEYETEVRRERVLAGQARARARGKRWGGSKPGERRKGSLSVEQEDTIAILFSRGIRKAEIARRLSISRQTVYAVLKRRPRTLFDPLEKCKPNGGSTSSSRRRPGQPDSDVPGGPKKV